MPNPKTGTVTDDTAKAVKEVKAGRVDYKVDKNANISAAVGKLSFSNESIAENIAALIDSVVKGPPGFRQGRLHRIRHRFMRHVPRSAG